MQRDSEELRELLAIVREAAQAIDRVATGQGVPLCGERYYTGRQVSQLFHISPRALQTYRDTRVIPYTSIGGKILYPESRIMQLLAANSVPSRK